METNQKTLVGSYLLGFLSIIIALSAFSAVPPLLNYQGRLTTLDGKPVADGDFGVRFTIYDDSLTNNALWAETLLVSTKDGLFSTLLGSQHPVISSMFADPNRWLGLAVGTDNEIQPRTRFASMAFAEHASKADTANVALMGGNSHWTVTDSVLYTDKYLGIARGGAGNILRYSHYSGSTDSIQTQVNLGVGCETNQYYTTVSGGFQNEARSYGATVSGGDGNIIDAFASPYSVISGGKGNLIRNLCCGGSVIGGGEGNSIGEDGAYSTICGGYQNHIYSGAAYFGYGFVGGGDGNFVYNDCAAICGGRGNSALGQHSTVGGGLNNTAGSYTEAQGETVGGGEKNNASGPYSTIPGGYHNDARGRYSFAAGSNAKANHPGSFALAAVSADGSDADSIRTGGDEQMVFRADGGIYITNTGGLAPYDTNRLINSSSGAYLSTSGVWTNASDRDLKENFAPVDGQGLLEKVILLPITRWNYKGESSGISHIGPVAQDFYSLFRVGRDSTSISTIDPSGISLAAIKELYKQNKQLSKEIEELNTLVRKLAANKASEDGDK